MTEVEQPSQNGIELTTEEDENNKARPADIEQDMREMERRKRVEAIMGSKLFREELERIVDSQIREGGASGILQQLSDIVGIPTTRVGNVFKSSNCVLPINDIRGVESMGYSKGEKILRCKLAATFRLLDLYGWTNGLGAQITARLKVDQELFLVNPYGLLYHEVTASSLNKVDMQGNVIEQGTTNFGVNKNQFILHSIVHAARPDIRCAIYIGCNPVIAVSSLKVGLLPVTNDSVVLGEISTYQYTGCLSDVEEREKLVRNLGPVSKVILLSNHGALCCGETIEEAFFAANHIVQACETQLKLLPMGVDNLVLIPEESRKAIYDAARRPPEDLAAAFEKKAALAASLSEDASTDKDESQTDNSKETSHKFLQQPKWRVGGAEFEALMRMLDNAGFRTGYIYRHPLIKSELPKAKNDVEVPPAVSSLGYLLEEEELYRQGIWKKGDWRKGGDRSRWLNSPNVYQKVEVLETGTPDPKKITKWVAEGSPTHSTPVRIEGALQFVPPGTNPKEFKKVQQQIKDNRRADKISAGPQSHILEGVTWDEANRIKDATVSSAGDHVVLMGAASKGIIQRGFQHNATVYKTPYAKNPFDNVTDDELNEYKRTVERKKNIHGEYTDTDFSESEALSSLQTSGAQQQNSSKTAVVSQSETEDASEHQVIRIETKQAPVPSQPEVVLSDATLDFLNGERQHTATNKTLPSPRAQENKTIKTPVRIITIDRSEQTDDQENSSSIDLYSSLDSSDLFNPIFADKFIMSHYHLKDIMQQQNPHSRSSYTDVQYGMRPFKLEISTSQVYPMEEDFAECYTPHICYPLMQKEVQAMHYPLLYKLGYSKSIFDFRSESYKSMEWKFKPYRTHSHFGFNYPVLRRDPEHFHIPVAPSKYVPLKKSLSYNEIFSSPRYVDLCDNCFEQILRFRPELPCSNATTEGFHVEAETKKSYTNVVLNDFNNAECMDLEEEEDSENIDVLEGVQNWIDNEHLNMSRVLEPVMEVDEDEVSDVIPMVDINSNVRVEDSSTFLDKITRMNYSEESTNIGFHPSKTVTSDITVPIQRTTDDLTNEMNCLSIDKSLEDDNAILLLAEQPFSDDRTVDVTTSTEAASSHSESNSARKLMTREERNQRKQEFNELWEDHIRYFTPLDSSGSDDEDLKLERNKSEIFFGESRFSSMSLVDDEEIEGSDSEISGTYRISSPSSSSDPAVHNPNFTEFFSFVNTEPLVSDSELNPMEQKIIEKIQVNRLKEQEPIFENIENAIRHKITPSKLERIVQNQRNDILANNQVIASTPELMGSMKSDSFYSLDVSSVDMKSETTQHPSRSMVCESKSRSHRLKQAPTYKDLSKVGQEQNLLNVENVSSSTDEPPSEMRPRNLPGSNNQMRKRVLSPDHDDHNPQRKHSKRNFVAENIRNASKPYRRHKANADNLFRGSSSTPCLSSEKSTLKQIQPVYLFQTKTVRGSPRFWVSLSARNKEHQPQKKPLKTKSIACQRRRLKQKEVKEDLIESKVDLDKINVKCDTDTNSPRCKGLQTEIECLGKRIDSLNPRLTHYRKTIDEYGDRISKISDTLDVVVDTQNEIEESRKELKGNMILGQYMEKICCDVQTFSLSETED